ncbi:MAG: hypothetical protein ACYDH9_01860 [Limisphaerales bacterium]
MTDHNPETDGLEPETFPNFNVVLVYEDFPAGVRAKQTLDRLLHDLDPQFVYNSKIWKFDILQISQLRELAAQDAADADLIILAACGTTELPAGVKCWINLWLARAGRSRRALVSLLDNRTEPATNRGSICSYLREIAQKGHMDFFCQEADWPNEETRSYLAKLRQDAVKKPSMMEEILRQTTPHPRWGINE